MGKFKAIAFDCFGTLFDMGGIPKEQIADYVQHVRRADFTPFAFAKEWYSLQAHPDVAEGIARLRAAGIKCVALSNGTWSMIFRLAANNGFAFDHFCDLWAAGVFKPHVNAYRVVEKETGFKPAETLMVTANPTFGDIEGSASIGMPSQVIRHGYPNTVTELAEMLGA